MEQQPVLLTASNIADLLASAASGLAKDQFHHGGHPQDIAAQMATAIEAGANLMVSLRDAEIVRWDQ